MVEKRETLVTRLHLFASKYKDDQYAAEALMSFFRGECMHISDVRGKCELCGSFQPHRTKN